MGSIFSKIKGFYREHTKAVWISTIVVIVVIVAAIAIIKRRKDPVEAGISAAAEATTAVGLTGSAADNAMDTAVTASTEIAQAPPAVAEQIAANATNEAELTKQAAENGLASPAAAAETFVVARACQEAYYAKKNK
jgi:hypothetical protein